MPWPEAQTVSALVVNDGAVRYRSESQLVCGTMHEQLHAFDGHAAIAAVGRTGPQPAALLSAVAVGFPLLQCPVHYLESSCGAR